MNLRPPGYEPGELPNCSTPRRLNKSIDVHPCGQPRATCHYSHRRNLLFTSKNAQVSFTQNASGSYAPIALCPRRLSPITATEHPPRQDSTHHVKIHPLPRDTPTTATEHPPRQDSPVTTARFTYHYHKALALQILPPRRDSRAATATKNHHSKIHVPPPQGSRTTDTPATATEHPPPRDTPTATERGASRNPERRPVTITRQPALSDLSRTNQQPSMTANSNHHWPPASQPPGNLHQPAANHQQLPTAVISSHRSAGGFQ